MSCPWPERSPEDQRSNQYTRLPWVIMSEFVRRTRSFCDRPCTHTEKHTICDSRGVCVCESRPRNPIIHSWVSNPTLTVIQYTLSAVPSHHMLAPCWNQLCVRRHSVSVCVCVCGVDCKTRRRRALGVPTRTVKYTTLTRKSLPLFLDVSASVCVSASASPSASLPPFQTEHFQSGSFSASSPWWVWKGRQPRVLACRGGPFNRAGAEPGGAREHVVSQGWEQACLHRVCRYASLTAERRPRQNEHEHEIGSRGNLQKSVVCLDEIVFSDES